MEKLIEGFYEKHIWNNDGMLRDIVFCWFYRICVLRSGGGRRMMKILDILKSVRPDSNFENSENFLADFLLDSFDIMEITAIIEDTFKIRIDIADILPDNYKDIPSIVSLIKQYGGERRWRITCPLKKQSLLEQVWLLSSVRDY